MRNPPNQNHDDLIPVDEDLIDADESETIPWSPEKHPLPYPAQPSAGRGAPAFGPPPSAPPRSAGLGALAFGAPPSAPPRSAPPASGAPPSVTPPSVAPTSVPPTFGASTSVAPPSTGVQSSNPGVVALDTGAVEGLSSAQRYEKQRRLGKGGMGDVLLCKDDIIGREVAMKVMLPNHARNRDLRARFIREAQVQGQLEHPSIVPVYDIGVDQDGSVFFTMKRLRGLTLAQIFKGLRMNKPEVVQAFPRRKLLNAFTAVCLALDFAHARGVLHRDLKPGNIMLGDFGEVYVLDWGIARIQGAAEPEVAIDIQPSGEIHETAVGAVLGSIGYMSPEQARGRHESLDARSEVFALGAILFEMLTLEPLIPRGDADVMLYQTLHGVNARISARAPDRSVPPELEAICVRATMPDPAARFASARELHDAVERYLDGDRDVELRRQIAAQHAAAAEEAAARALAGGADSEGARRTALREVGRVLALDPTNEAAARILGRVLTEPPREAPAEVTAELEKSIAEQAKFRMGLGAKATLGTIAFLAPFTFWMGVRNWTTMAVVLGLHLLVVLTRAIGALTRPNSVIYKAVYLITIVGFASQSQFFGPLFFMPVPMMIECVMADQERRPFVIGSSIAVLLGMVGLEVAGVLPASYVFRDGAMTILPHGVFLPEVATLVFLTLGTVFSIVAPSNSMSQLQAALRAAEQRILMQSWHLRQILPDQAREQQS